MTDKNRVYIFDTTLRDGEQSPGATMSHAEKLEIAAMLDEMGVDIIEAGFPMASEGDFNAVSEIARQTKNSVICGLARAQLPDIDRCWEAVKHAQRPRIHTFIGTSPLHRAIPNLDMDQMADRIHQTVTHARNLCDNVQWSPMDATRTEHDYLCRVVEIAIKAGLGKIEVEVAELTRQLYLAGFQELPVTWQHTLKVGSLPNHHKDPFDRLLIAQALSEPLRLLTADRQLPAYSSDLVTLV